jgi:hypothetical protein
MTEWDKAPQGGEGWYWVWSPRWLWSQATLRFINEPGCKDIVRRPEAYRDERYHGPLTPPAIPPLAKDPL